MLLFCPSPTALFLHGSILFPFLLSIIAPGAVRFCILCNIPSLRPFYPLFPSSLPHLSLPSISIMPVPSCHKCAVHTPRTSCRLGCSPTNTASSRGIPLPTCTQVGLFPRLDFLLVNFSLAWLSDNYIPHAEGW